MIGSKNKGLLHQVSGDGRKGNLFIAIIFVLFLFLGTTPVYFSAQEGKLDAMRFLHETAKCDISIPAGDNLKPIHAAAQAGHTSIVKVLLLHLLLLFISFFTVYCGKAWY